MSPEKRSKVVILLSAGLDSTVNFYWALKHHEVVLALTFDYGQVAAIKEIDRARNLCEKHKVSHKVIDLKWFSDFSQSALNRKQSLPVGEELKIDDYEASKASAHRVWVPNRNGIFLNVAAGYAEGLSAELVVPGFNKEEAETFPDNSKSFVDALNKSFSYSTDSRVRVECFTTDLSKKEIVKLGISLGVDFSMTWACYQDEDSWCGQCESCQRFKRALAENGKSFEEIRSI